MSFIYFDNYRTTPISDHIKNKMKEYVENNYFLPVSFTSRGTQAAENIENAKERIMNSFSLENGDVIFTMGGTHANNLVINGLMRDADLSNTEMITSVIDHPSIVNVYEHYKKKGAKVHFLKVDEAGYIDEELLKNSINENTLLFSITLVNHTIGTIQKIDRLIEIVKTHNKKIKVLVDVCTAANSLKIDMNKLDIDFLTFSGHKIYGPRGIGAVVMKNKNSIKPTIFGTVTTSPLTPGADNVPGIMALADALEDAVQKREDYIKHTSALQKRLMDAIEKNIPDILLNGPEFGERASDNVNYSFRFIEGESIMMFLDFEDIVVATGSACASSDLKVNYILSAIGRDHEMSHGSIRITFGWDNTLEQVDSFCEELIPIVQRLRSQSTIR